jgi:hypothetical protein
MANDQSVSFTVRVKDAASAALKEIEKAADHVTEKLFSFKDILKDLTAAAAAFSLAEIVKDMVELGVSADKTFRTIAANLPTFTEGIARLKEEIESLADASGRSIEELEQTAATISKLGVSSAEELQQQLAAATKLADATGSSVEETAQLLIQLRREFHLTGEEALETAAKLASATQGKVSVTELFSAFQASAPIFQKFGIDVDTATKAIVALIQKGDGLRQVRSEIGQLDKAGIEEYASQAKIAGDAMEQLSKRAALNEASTAATLERLKNSWKESLEGIYGHIQTFVAGAYTLFEKMGGVSGQLERMGFLGTAAAYRALTFKSTPVLSSTFTNVGTANPAAPHVMTAEEKKQAEEAALAQKKLALQLDETATKEKLAADNARVLAKAQGEDLVIAVESALAAATGHAAQAAAAAIDERALKLKNEIALNNELSIAQKERLLNEVELTRLIDQAKNAAQPALQKAAGAIAGVGAPGTTPQDSVTAINAAAQELIASDVEILKVNNADADIKKALLDLDKKRAEILKGMVTVQKDGNVDLKRSMQDTVEQARAIRDAADGALQLAGAFGLVDQKTTNTLRSVVEIATQIPVVASQLAGLGKSDAQGNPLATIGSVVGSILPIAGGLATIASSVLGGKDQAELEHQKVIEDNSAALRHLSETIKGVVVPPGAYSAAGQAIDTLIKHGSTAGSQYAFGGIGVKADLSGLTPLQIDELNAAAKALGITLDGTEATFLQLKAAIDKAEPGLEKAYLEQQKQEQEDLHVRLLRAQGLNAEADAEEFAEKQTREMDAAIAAHADQATIDALATTQAAEATAFHAQQAQKAAEDLLNAATTFADQYDQIHHVTDPTQQFADKAKAYAGAGGALGDLFKGFDLAHLSPGDIAKLDASFQDLFDKIKNSPDSVDTAGLSIDDLIQALLDLDKSAQNASSSAENAARSFSDLSSSISDYEDVHDITDPYQQVGDRSKAFKIDLSQYDLKTKAGRDGALSYLVGLWDYPGLDPNIKLEVKSLIDSIRHLPPLDGSTDLGALGGAGSGATSAVAAGYQNLTTIQGDRLADLELRHLNVSLESRDYLKEIRDSLTIRFQPPALTTVNAPSSAPQSSSGGGGGGGPSVVVNVGGVTLNGASGDASAFAGQISAELARQISIALGRGLIQQAINRGTIDVASPFVGSQ